MSYQTVSIIVKPYHDTKAGYTIQTYEDLGDIALSDIPRIGEGMSFNGKQYIVESITHIATGDIMEDKGMKFLHLKKKMILKEKKPPTF